MLSLSVICVSCNVLHFHFSFKPVILVDGVVVISNYCHNDAP